MRLSDNELVQLFRHDPDRAIGLIFDAYYQAVCGHIYRLIPVREITEDIAQSLFLELWQKRNQLEIRSSIGAYLHRMARTRTLNYIRDHRRHQYHPEEEVRDLEATNQTPLQEMMGMELQEAIHKAIDQLPERCRLVFVLSRYEGMSYREISEALEISPKTVENQMSKALQSLRIALSGYDRGIGTK